ncbi:hypothetical protein GCM10025858_09140 [Alicyclobacillus sacchari]|nr:hypothetical protein GCM10025858_09140 [Alicyclobacillus sacchari]
MCWPVNAVARMLDENELNFHQRRSRQWRIKLQHQAQTGVRGWSLGLKLLVVSLALLIIPSLVIGFTSFHAAQTNFSSQLEARHDEREGVQRRREHVHLTA